MVETYNVPKTRRSICRLTIMLIGSIFILTAAGSALAAPDLATSVPVEDTISLATRVYLPADTGTYPTILLRTPYSGDWLEAVAKRFTEAGYATVVQDVRGMGESGGSFLPFVNEHTDGVATVTWIGSQPWSDSRVALWGVSYLAHCGLEIARAGLPEVKALVNVSGWTDLSAFLTRGGSFRLVDQLPWLISYAGGQHQIPDQAWAGIFRATPLMQYFGGVADEVGAAMGEPYDYSRLTAPTLHITGWQDYIGRNTLDAYLESRTHNPESKLIVGPWTHNQIFDEDSSSYGDADFGPASTMGLDSLLTLSLAWFDRHVKGDRVATESLATVTYFIQNANTWEASPTWPPPESETKTFYLAVSNGAPVLQPSVSQQTADLSFRYDPNDPVPTIGGPISFRPPFNVGVKDQRALESRSDILFFDSEPFTSSMTLAGPMTVELYAATDSVDTDFTAKLVEVRKDGYARMIEDGIMRARYLSGLDSAVLIAPGHVYHYTIDLGHTAHEIAAGSRLRLEISSGNFPKYDRNPNDGTEPFEATGFREARQTVFMSPAHPSSVTFTVLTSQ